MTACPRCSIGTTLIFGDTCCIVCVSIPEAHAALLKEIQEKRDIAESSLREANKSHAELLRLLERHHAAWVARERLTPKYAMLYTGTELCKQTVAVIAAAKDDPVAFTRERYGKTLRDLAAHDAHRAEESALKERA